MQPLENPVQFKNVVALAFDYGQTAAGTNRIFFSDVHFGNIQMINDDWMGRVVIAESKEPQQPKYGTSKVKFCLIFIF